MTLLTDLQEQEISKATLSRFMNNQVSVFTAFSPTFLQSLANLHCPSNKPLFVFPYGERMARNSLIQVSFKLNEDLIKNFFQISTILAIEVGVVRGNSNVPRNSFITAPLHKALWAPPPPSTGGCRVTTGLCAEQRKAPTRAHSVPHKGTPCI